MESIIKVVVVVLVIVVVVVVVGVVVVVVVERLCDMMDVDNNIGVMRSNISIDDCKKSLFGVVCVL